MALGEGDLLMGVGALGLFFEYGWVYSWPATAPKKWYNMYLIDMSGEMLMRCEAKALQMRYSAAYPMGREHML